MDINTNNTRLKLVWLFNEDRVSGLWETDWIRELLPKETLFYEEICYDPSEDENASPRMFQNACIVFSHALVGYESYFRLYENAGIPFGVIHLSDETLGDTSDYLSLRMCRFAYRNYFHPVFSTHPKVMTFGLGYKKGFVASKMGVVQHHHSPWFHWCFAGVLHNPKRTEALLHFERFIPHLLVGSRVLHKGVSIVEYRAIFECSKFALCPIGQCNIDTFRFYEALECNTIPVVVGNTPDQRLDEIGKLSYWHAMFPGESDPFPWVQADTWQECANQVENILHHPETYFEMQERCKEFWNRWKKKWSQHMMDSFMSLTTVV